MILARKMAVAVIEPARRSVIAERCHVTNDIRDEAKLPSSPASAAYGAFLWQLMKTREALTSLSAQTFAVSDRKIIDYSAEADPTRLVLGLLAAAGRSMRNDIAQTIRNNCAGAILQIAWTLFDAHLEMLGFTLDERRVVRGGVVLAGGEPFSQVLWASRNAFAHGFEWASSGPKTKAGKISVGILHRSGFTAPSHNGVFDYFCLLSNGNIETFLRRLEVAAKDVAESRMVSTHATPSSAPSALLVALVALGALALAYFSAEEKAKVVDDELLLVFQVGRGAEARVVTLATGAMHSPHRIRSIMEEQAVLALSAGKARPFKEAEKRFTAWAAQAEALFVTEIGSERFYKDLIDLTDRMDEIYEMTIALPDPISVLLRERGADSLEDTHAVLSEILSAHPDYVGTAFRVIEKDITPPTAGKAAESG